MYDTLLLKEQLASPKRIVVVMHTEPDADALGTSLALTFFLREQGHIVSVVSPTEYPSSLSWLPEVNLLLVSERSTSEALFRELGHIDLLFCVDFSTVGRLGGLAFILQDPSIFKVVIDHHTEPGDFADLFFWDPKAAATAEVLFQLFEALGYAKMITVDMATCLYAALVTDTNSFKNSTTTHKTHRIAAALIEAGADNYGVQRSIYSNKSLSSLHFFSFAISQRLVVLPEFHAAYFVIQKEDYKRYDLKGGDIEGLVDCALSLKGVLLAAVLKEKDDSIHISFRSIGALPVNLIAKNYFNGGGHKNAAGGVSYLSLTETVDQFEQILRSGQF